MEIKAYVDSKIKNFLEKANKYVISLNETDLVEEGYAPADFLTCANFCSHYLFTAEQIMWESSFRPYLSKIIDAQWDLSEIIIYSRFRLHDLDIKIIKDHLADLTKIMGELGYEG